MSDNWVQCPICGGDVGDEAVADYDRAAYETGVQDSMLRATQYERILQDLIAELRDAHYNDQCGCGCEQWYECKPCLHVGLCPSQEAAVRAEQRLREVSDE